jgi:tungstate transport system permease protein
VQFLLEMIRQGYNLIPLDPYLQLEIQTTLRLAFYSTGIAILIGVVPPYLIGVRTARLSRWGLIVSNAALGLPSVSVGIVLFISLPGNTPWGPGWFGINAMILGQTVLATPIIIALSAAAIRGLPDGLIDQARAFGAYGWRLGAFAFREARIGILILGVNQEDANATVSSDILNDIGPHAGTGFAAQSRGAAAGVPAAVEHSIVVLAMLIPLGVILTIVQQWGRNSRAQQQSAAPSDGVTAG